VVPGGSGITVRQLLNHTSGIFNYTDDQPWRAGLLANPTREWSARELIAVATAHPQVFPPGTSWSYSNTNYVLAGLIAETVAGRPLPRLITERITRPLRLSDTYLATDTQIRPGHIHGYFPPSTMGSYVDTTTWNPTAAGAAGAMVSTASDLARFYRGLLSGHLLAPAQLREMKTTVYVAERNGGYGLGLYYLNTPCGTVWGHSGSFPGYNSVAYQDRSGRRSAVLFMATEPDQTTGPLFNKAVDEAVCQMLS
jgi:D-alanyl-D-alanine carboxypeptidase